MALHLVDVKLSSPPAEHRLSVYLGSSTAHRTNLSTSACTASPFLLTHKDGIVSGQLEEVAADKFNNNVVCTGNAG